VRSTHEFNQFLTISPQKKLFFPDAIDKKQKSDNALIVTTKKTGFGVKSIKSACLVIFTSGQAREPYGSLKRQKMELNMKKLIFAVLAALLAFALVTCDLETPLDGIPNVEYAKDLSSVTFRLDGGGTAKSISRALTLQMAQAGLELFEVVFYDGTTVARASWEIGKTVSIKDVPTVAAGTNYGSVTPSTTVPSAVLFAGKKNGILLAVGKITAVDGIVGATTIFPTSTTATFGLAALLGNVKTDFELNVSNDATPYEPTDFTINVDYGQFTSTFNGADFLVNAIKAGTEDFGAIYTLSTSATTFDIDAMLPAIRYKDTGKETVAFQQPLFQTITGHESLNPEYYPAGISVEIFDTLIDDGALPFTDGEISFYISTLDKSLNGDGIISFYFDIPVYALTNIASSSVPPISSKLWYLNSGSAPLYIDNGRSGGAIFLYIDDGLPTSLNLTRDGDGLLIIAK